MKNIEMSLEDFNDAKEVINEILQYLDDEIVKPLEVRAEEMPREFAEEVYYSDDELSDEEKIENKRNIKIYESKLRRGGCDAEEERENQMWEIGYIEGYKQCIYQLKNKIGKNQK